MNIRHFVLFGLLCVVLLTGCDQKQIGKADQFFSDANSWGDLLRLIPETPAGVILPPVIRLIMEILGVTAAAALVIWQQIKHKLTKKTLTAVTKGVQQLDDKSRQEVKDLVEAEMVELAKESGMLYRKMNAEVDRAKAS